MFSSISKRKIQIPRSLSKRSPVFAKPRLSHIPVFKNIRKISTFDHPGEVFKLEPSVSLSEASMKSRSLYRHCIRNSGTIVQAYTLESAGITTAKFKKMIRERFEHNTKLTDLTVIDRLLFLGAQDLEESIRHWKTKHHVLNFLLPSLNKGNEATKSFNLKRDTVELFFAGDTR